MNLKDVYSIKEASELWSISESNLRNALNRYNRFDDQIKRGLAKKSGGTWIVTKQAMKEVFGLNKDEKIIKDKLKSINKLATEFDVSLEESYKPNFTIVVYAKENSDEEDKIVYMNPFNFNELYNIALNNAAQKDMLNFIANHSE